MPNTPAPTSLPYPALADAPNSPQQLQALADRIAAYYPRGLVGRDLLDATTAYVEADTVITTLAVTFTAYAGRRYRGELQVATFDANSTTACAAVATIRWAAGTAITATSTLLAEAKTYLISSNSALASGGHAANEFAPAAGTTTVGVSLKSTVAGVGVRMFGGGEIVRLAVYDVGPV